MSVKIDLKKYTNYERDDYSESDNNQMFNEFVGHHIEMCMISSDQRTMYWCVDGSFYEVIAEADCCSESWFNHCDNASALIDATLLEFESVAVGEVEEDDAQILRKKRLAELLGNGNEYNDANDCIQGNMLKFKTDKGHCTIEFRNASNGYYVGHASIQKFEPKTWKEKNELDIAKELEDFQRNEMS